MATANNPFEQIILPTTLPSAWPPAPIYWVITSVFIVSMILLFLFIKRRISHKKYVKQTLSALAQLQQQKASFVQLNQLLKGLCLHYYPRQQVASLTGKEWFIFIQQHNAQKATPLFDDVDTFCERLYQLESTCTKQEFKAASTWVKTFPKQVLSLQKSMQVGK